MLHERMRKDKDCNLEGSKNSGPGETVLCHDADISVCWTVSERN